MIELPYRDYADHIEWLFAFKNPTHLSEIMADDALESFAFKARRLLSMYRAETARSHGSRLSAYPW